MARSTLDRWIRAWRAGGYEALVPEARAGVPLTDAAVLGLAERLKREEPRRTAAHITALLATQG
ncbi:MAG: DDE-type integrase/transposase/recombinase, partial [Acidimicrobiales bacterium]